MAHACQFGNALFSIIAGVPRALWVKMSRTSTGHLSWCGQRYASRLQPLLEAARHPHMVVGPPKVVDSVHDLLVVRIGMALAGRASVQAARKPWGSAARSRASAQTPPDARRGRRRRASSFPRRGSDNRRAQSSPRRDRYRVPHSKSSHRVRCGRGSIGWRGHCSYIRAHQTSLEVPKIRSAKLIVKSATDHGHDLSQ